MPDHRYINLRIFFLIGLFFLLQAGAESFSQVPDTTAGPALSVSFIRPELIHKEGQLSFNIVRVKNLTGQPVRFKPVLFLPDDWLLVSTPINDTAVRPGDSISLAYRFRLPPKISAEEVHEVFFRAMAATGRPLAENSFRVTSEPFHQWDLALPESRLFFFPRFNMSSFYLEIQNLGNVTDTFKLNLELDRKLQFSKGQEASFEIVLPPFSDTLFRVFVEYASDEDRIFDIAKVMVHVTCLGGKKTRPVMFEKYNDIYAPFNVDRNLPHEVELGLRHFENNDELLPFVKARGLTTFRNQSKLMYNFNYYSVTGNEDFISNSYYTFLYTWQQLQVGLGAFSSQLGRNLYTRNGVMVSNTIKLSPGFSLEGFAAQSLYTPKTSAAVGVTLNAHKKVTYNGSVSYDYDREKFVNTASAIFRTSLIPITPNHEFSFNIYGYQEKNSRFKEYTQLGFAYDLFYTGRIGDVLSIRFINNYGSPDVPGAQMGLLNFGLNSVILIGDKGNNFGIEYINARRKYHGYTYEGDRLPDARLYDQYARLLYHSGGNPNHIFDAGPSIEFYRSVRPVTGIQNAFSEYSARKLRFEYKASIFKHLTLNIKTGVSNVYIRETTESRDQKIDFHVLGGYSFNHGIALAFTYDYGPMVNSGLYQFSGDVENHSFSIGPSITKTFFKERVSFSLFANLVYRFDLDYAAFNVNPKLEAYLFRDYYLVVGGTYHYTRQEYTNYLAQNDYYYLEVSVKKRFGKSDFNKWQRDTRRLKIVLFQDENANGIKEDNERGVPHVKTRIKLTQSGTRNVSTEFPVDITLLSNEEGIVIYNRLPLGFYDLTITPLGDVKEYFYVNRSAEKLELTDNAVYYIPFQKATKISGKITMKRSQFIKKGEEDIDLTNIRITAYNDLGNSYSTFTLSDGSFVIYVPGNSAYHVRMPNVFGDNFKILKNDINIVMGSEPFAGLIFEVVEGARQVKFKSGAPAAADTAKQAPLKIKVLHGKFYENRTDTTANKDALPEFNIQYAPPEAQEMLPGNLYVILREVSGMEEGARYRQVMLENGINAYVGLVRESGQYFVFSNYYATQPEARREADQIKKRPGMNEVYILKLEMDKAK